MPSKRDAENFKIIYRNLNDTAKKEIISNYQLALKSIKAELLPYYEKANKAGIKLTLNEMNKFNRLQKLFSDVNDNVNFLTGKNKSAVGSQGRELYGQMYNRVLYRLEQESKIGILFTKVNPAIVKQSIFSQLDKIAMLKNNQALKAKVKTVLTQNLIQGKSFFQMAADLKDTLGGDVNKWTTIARTEGSRVQNEAIIEGYDTAQENGLKFNREIVSVKDNRTRPQSARMDGQIADKDGFFTYPGGIKTRIPGTTGNPAFDINDREVVITVLKDQSPEFVRIKGEGIVPNESFESWGERKGLTKNIYGQKYSFDK